MAKCLYCHDEENGDIPDDRIPLVEERNIELPVKVNFSVEDNTEKMKVKIPVWFQAMIYENGGEHVLSIVAQKENETKEDPCFFETMTKINYCPICGRKFK